MDRTPIRLTVEDLDRILNPKLNGGRLSNGLGNWVCRGALASAHIDERRWEIFPTKKDAANCWF